MTEHQDIVIVGGGIVGLATALQLAQQGIPRLAVIEAEHALAQHQTGHNSGVIHSGLYYKPGSLRAKNCVEGQQALYRFCQEHGIAHERCGKVVVAVEPHELPFLDRLEARGQANGLLGLRRLSADEVKEHEPHVRAVAGLYVPTTGIVDYSQVAAKYAELIRYLGGEIHTTARLTRVRHFSQGLGLETTAGRMTCRLLVGCAGLQADRVARLSGVDPGVQIVPFRGEYYALRPERRHLVRNLIYPVPDPRFPFLGVHFTRNVQGEIDAGPNAVLAFRREGYTRWQISVSDMVEMCTYGGFWRFLLKHLTTGAGELYRSFRRKAFLRAMQRLIPEVQDADIVPYGAGVRAQALDPRGRLVDDFHVVEADRMIHVLNAPSPAATASLSVGAVIAGKARQRFQNTVMPRLFRPCG